MYLLICDVSERADVCADLLAELDVQLGARLPVEGVRELLEQRTDVALGDQIRVLSIDRWSPDLIDLLDTHVIRLERTGAQFLFITTDSLADQLLTVAPNFRNRLTEILRIFPDDPSGGSLN